MKIHCYEYKDIVLSQRSVLVIIGMLYKKGEKWSNGDLNGCSKCKCVAKSAMKGVIECTKPTCPRLNCAFKVYPRGKRIKIIDIVVKKIQSNIETRQITI